MFVFFGEAFEGVEIENWPALGEGFDEAGLAGGGERVGAAGEVMEEAG